MADEDYETVAVEVKGMHECRHLQSSERRNRTEIGLATRTDNLGNSKNCGIITGDLNLPYVDWNGNAECDSRSQSFLKRSVSENGGRMDIVR
jgi:hypothetical protein